jgi:glycosyltransferase involved in cell wall biosynthesis
MNLDYPKDRYEIIVLDGFSTDGTLDIVKNYPVTVHKGNWNVPTFYNHVLKELKGELIAFGDGDAIVDKDWLKVLVPHFMDGQVAGAGGLCLTANPEQIVPRVIGYELKARYERMPKNISRIATMNVLYRKSSLIEIGGFDERFDTGYDTDIGHRICKAAYLIHFDPKAIVYHYNRPNLKSYFRQQYIYGWNMARMYLQHMNIAAGDEITPLWMNIQPFIYTLIALTLVCAFFVPVAGIIAAILVIGLLLGYSISSIKLSIRENDVSALFFIVLCFVRGTGWTAGGGGYVVSWMIQSLNGNTNTTRTE